jgi:uncharacterized protein YkwD
MSARADFSDVSANHPYKTAILYLQEKNVIAGYPDGTFKPEKLVNRAEFTKIMVEAALKYSPSTDPSGYDIFSLSGVNFKDAESGQWYVPYLRKATESGMISGYPDGTFKPAGNINLVEASKILTNAFKVPQSAPKGSEWYSPFLEALSDSEVLPDSFTYLSQPVTRGQMAEMVWRILENKKGEPSTTAEKLTSQACVPLGENLPNTIDMDRVRSTWLGWYNDVRAAEGLSAYTLNDQLSRTATVWSEYSETQGKMSHNRPGTTVYYDYPAIEAWFKDLGLTFKNVSRVTFTENIGWGIFSCEASDCTDALIDSIRSTFNFYMAEKNDSYRPHYNSVMNAYFKEIGLGLALDETTHKYYLTVHYATEITSNPPSICK